MSAFLHWFTTPALTLSPLTAGLFAGAARALGELVVLAIRTIYRAEFDLKIERRIAHMFGWHSDGCRGFEKCWPYRTRTAFRGRWWR